MLPLERRQGCQLRPARVWVPQRHLPKWRVPKHLSGRLLASGQYLYRWWLPNLPGPGDGAGSAESAQCLSAGDELSGAPRRSVHYHRPRPRRRFRPQRGRVFGRLGHHHLRSKGDWSAHRRARLQQQRRLVRASTVATLIALTSQLCCRQLCLPGPQPADRPARPVTRAYPTAAAARRLCQ